MTTVSKAKYFFLAKAVLSRRLLWALLLANFEIILCWFHEKKRSRKIWPEVNVIWRDESRQVKANWPTECFGPKIVLCIVKLTLNVDLYVNDNFFSKMNYFFPSKLFCRGGYYGTIASSQLRDFCGRQCAPPSPAASRPRKERTAIGSGIHR